MQGGDADHRAGGEPQPQQHQAGLDAARLAGRKGEAAGADKWKDPLDEGLRVLPQLCRPGRALVRGRLEGSGRHSATGSSVLASNWSWIAASPAHDRRPVRSSSNLRRMPTVPGRIRWAVDLLDIHPDHRIMEIGCGPGVAAGLVAERLSTGHLVAIDRSATAISRAAARNAGHLDTGRLTLVTTDLAAYEHTGPPFDTIFAMNLNVFWTGPAGPEWTAIDKLLRPGGTLVLFYGYGPGDPAPGGRAITGTLRARLVERGYTASVLSAPDESGICVFGRR